jgi:hypothetical protein
MLCDAAALLDLRMSSPPSALVVVVVVFVAGRLSIEVAVVMSLYSCSGDANAATTGGLAWVKSSTSSPVWSFLILKKGKKVGRKVGWT